MKVVPKVLKYIIIIQKLILVRSKEDSIIYMSKQCIYHLIHCI